MAEKPAKRSFPTHPLVAKLLGDQAEPGREVVLAGYIGPSASPDRVRLYLDLGLNRYVDIPTDAIRDTWQSDPDDENSPTQVAVDGAAELDHVTVARQTAGARFLQGPIVDEYGLGGGAAPGAITQTVATVCTYGGCTLATVCTQDPACPHQTWICPPDIGPRTLLGCPRTVSCPPQNTAATVCTQLGCPNTVATVCTQLGCPRTVACPPQDVVTTVCTQAPGCYGHNTAATLCTQDPGCLALDTAVRVCPPPTPRCPSNPWICAHTPDCPTLTWPCPIVTANAVCLPTIYGCDIPTKTIAGCYTAPGACIPETVQCGTMACPPGGRV